jgi:UDP-N-acetyl-D-galactosamine dehydrogenase
MTNYVINNILKFLKKKKIKINKAKLLILGISFKKNCTDIRNSKIIEIVNFFKSKKSHIQLYDPLVDSEVLSKQLQNPFPNFYLCGEPYSAKHQQWMEGALETSKAVCDQL